MTRAEKKCLAFSLGMHSLLAIILIGSAAFQTMPKHSDMAVLNMIPSRILDEAGSGGGNPAAAETPPPPMQPVTPPQPQPQPQPPTPQPVKQAKPPPPEPVRHEEPKPDRVETKPVEKPLPDTRAELPSPKPPRKQHEIKVDYTPYNASAKPRTKPKVDENAEANAAAQAAAAAQAKRDRAIRQALNSLASGLEVKASQHAIVDTKGDGGESYANYNSVIQSIYFHAWTTPDNVANKLAQAKVKLTLARDGSVISAEIIDSSGESAVDKSVERALHSVTHVPPFPAESHDSQRTFFILFNLEAKEATG